MGKTLRVLNKALAGRMAFFAFVAVFVVLALRVAINKVYPLAYDEAFHFGLIKIYTQHLNPFLAGQPANSNQYGAIATMPSYLYHYLMSFPLRFISLFSHSIHQQVLILRMLNIGMGVTTLILTRKIAMRVGVSKPLVNLAVLGMAITPVFYDLSGQINYDNLLIPLTLLTVLATWNVSNSIKAGNVQLVKLGQLGSLLLLTSLVKYSFLPILVAVVGYVLVLLAVQAFKHSLHLEIHWKSLSVLLTIILVVVSGTLWSQRYVVNVAKYHQPNPQCDAVLDVKTCASYPPWNRNYQLRQIYINGQVTGALPATKHFIKIWSVHMYDSVFSVTQITATGGLGMSKVIDNIQKVATVLIIGGAAYILLRLRRFTTGLPWVMLGLTGFMYTFILWAQNFADFHHLGQMVAVQGRYILPVLPIVYALIARSYTLMIKDLQLGKLRKTVMDYATYAYVLINMKTYRFE